jgi:hypothetical protein
MNNDHCPHCGRCPTCGQPYPMIPAPHMPWLYPTLPNIPIFPPAYVPSFPQYVWDNPTSCNSSAVH